MQRRPIHVALILVSAFCCLTNARADVITFTHTDTTTSYGLLPGGGTGHVLEIRFSDANVGIENRDFNLFDFVDATFTTGSYEGMYTAITSAVFQTDASGDVEFTRFQFLTPGTDNSGGGGTALINNSAGNDYGISSQTGQSVVVNNPSWMISSDNTGWSAAVPEPSSLAAIGLIGFALAARRRRSS